MKESCPLCNKSVSGFIPEDAWCEVHYGMFQERMLSKDAEPRKMIAADIGAVELLSARQPIETDTSP